ncbi:MAG: peptidylprolyl isomerase [Rubellimicrobium sp.]|nr:peptidylprolyl isomerase [Rubellimicrobium sp.]
MFRQALLATAAAVALPLSAAAQDEATRDTVVATVDGVEITLGEMIITAAQLPPQYQMLSPEILFFGVMDQLIQQQLLADTLTTDPARVTMALTNQRRSLLAGEVINAMSMEVVPDEDLQAAYDELFGGAEPEREFSASHILVETAEEAQDVLDRIAAGETFEDLARELSQDPGSGAMGGELGWFGLGMMVAPFEQAVTALAEEGPGSLSEPVQTQFGFHIVRLNDTRIVEAPTLDEVRDQIAEQVRQRRIEGVLTGLLETADITRVDEDAFDPSIILDLGLLED